MRERERERWNCVGWDKREGWSGGHEMAQYGERERVGLRRRRRGGMHTCQIKKKNNNT